MKHCIYKVTNLINGNYYIGKHSSEDPATDDYMGSGASIKAAIRKYGVENFKKEILGYYNTSEEAYLKEQELVSLNALNDKRCYNRCTGGCGGRKGSVHMHRGASSILVHGSKVPYFLDQGYVLGRSEDTVQRHTEWLTGRVTVYRENRERSILFEELDNYIAKGWVRGRSGRFSNKISKYNKRFIWVHRGDVESKIDPVDKDAYLNSGWVLGHSKKYRDTISKANSGRIRIHNCSEEKMVLPEELEMYEKSGWSRGYSDQSKISRQHSGRFYWGNNGNVERKFTLVENLPDGWVKGRVSNYSKQVSVKLRGRVTVHRNDEERKILQEHLQDALNDGWQLGRSEKNIKLAKQGKFR